MKLIVATMLLLGGCAAGHRDLTKDIVKQDRCVAKRAERFVGRAGTPPVAEKAREAAGAVIVRVLKPGEMVTMEYQEGRLNLMVDVAGKIIGVRCG